MGYCSGVVRLRKCRLLLGRTGELELDFAEVGVSIFPIPIPQRNKAIVEQQSRRKTCRASLISIRLFLWQGRE